MIRMACLLKTILTFALISSTATSQEETVFKEFRPDALNESPELVSVNWAQLDTLETGSDKSRTLDFSVLLDPQDEGGNGGVQVLEKNARNVLQGFKSIEAKAKDVGNNILFIEGQDSNQNSVYLYYGKAKGPSGKIEPLLVGNFDSGKGDRVHIRKNSSESHSIEIVPPNLPTKELCCISVDHVSRAKKNKKKSKKKSKLKKQRHLDGIARNGCPPVKPRIDIAFVFTQKVVDDEAYDMNTYTYLCIAHLNKALEDSGIDATASRVASELLMYDESQHRDNIKKQLDLLRRKDDQFLNSVHAIRKRYNADIVCLIVNQHGTPGYAYRMTRHKNNPGFSDYAFCVVRNRSVFSLHAITHEIGHILGACHACELEKPLFSFASPHTYIVDGSKVSTVMAGTGNRKNWFSNPFVLDSGVRTGTRFSNHASCIDQTAITASLFSNRLDR